GFIPRSHRPSPGCRGCVGRNVRHGDEPAARWATRWWTHHLRPLTARPSPGLNSYDRGTTPLGLLRMDRLDHLGSTAACHCDAPSHGPYVSSGHHRTKMDGFAGPRHVSTDLHPCSTPPQFRPRGYPADSRRSL